MLYQAKAFGASAVLLICAILDNSQLKAFGELAQELGLDALVEAHDQWEVDRALNLGAKIVGVNNRNLHDFTVDMGNSIRLRNMAPLIRCLFPKVVLRQRRISVYYMKTK